MPPYRHALMLHGHVSNSASIFVLRLISPMNGVPFHYWSFTVAGYREILNANGLTLLDVHRDAGQNVYYLARSDAAKWRNRSRA